MIIVHYKDGQTTLQEGHKSAGKRSGEFVRWEYSPFSNDAGDVFRRRDIEGGIVHVDTGWCDRMAAVDGSHLGWAALFDRNLISGLSLEIDC